MLVVIAPMLQWALFHETCQWNLQLYFINFVYDITFIAIFFKWEMAKTRSAEFCNNQENRGM